MRSRRRAATEDLRQALRSLPRATRLAMLEGLVSNEIIVGAYATRDGICPMLAAHRAGGRTSCISFARAWDRFGFRNSRRPRPRRATEREVLILRSHLQVSLLEDERHASPPASPAIRVFRRKRDQDRLPDPIAAYRQTAEKPGHPVPVS